jgi:hypothetical protein
MEEIMVPDSSTFEAELSHFLDCLEEDREPTTSAREERKPLLAVLATYASIEKGERIYLRDFDQSQGAPR